MRIHGVSEADIRKAVAEARLSVWGDYPQNRDWQDRSLPWSGGIYAVGTGLRVRLGVDRTQPRDENGLLPFQKLGYRGRRLPYVTWEGHREFMRVIFRDHPEARIKTALADYHGRAEFWAKHPETRTAWAEGQHHY